MAVLAAPLALAAAGTGVAARAPAPKPVPVQTLPAPTSFQVTSSEPVRVIANIDAGTPYTDEVQVLSGPSGGGALNPFLSYRGYWFSPLLANNDYVIRARRIYSYDPIARKLTTVTSPWTTFTFHTPTLEASRPSAPVLRAGPAFSPSNVGIDWNPSTDNGSTSDQIQYTWSLNGVDKGPTCSLYCFGSTGLEIPRPAPGASARVVVTAIDDVGIASLPSAAFVVNG